MLGSINPLGERARRSRWWLTVTAYAAASVAGGMAAGAVLGLAGRFAIPPSVVPSSLRLAALAILIAAGVVLDTRLLVASLPTGRRQVNEDWLTAYRGWVYGVGFGFQLGLGMVTVVTVSAVYLTFAAAFLSGSALAGAMIGAVFGVIRAFPAVSVWRVRRGDQLGALDALLRRWDRPARALAVGAEVALLAAAAGLAVVR